MNPEVDKYLEKTENWQDVLEALRNILLECMLTEELKWKQPCYSLKDANIAMIGKFKTHCVLSFFKGVLLKDEANLLVPPGPNSQTVMMFKFTSTEEVQKLEPTIKAYIFEAIEIEKAGLKVEMKKDNTGEYSEELFSKFKSDPKFEAAFEALTPGRKRGYNLFFNGAKQSSTRTTRIEKYVDRIFKGQGINDCVCGLSKRKPNCDGSHKFIK